MIKNLLTLFLLGTLSSLGLASSSTFDPFDKKYCTVNGLNMAYVDTGYHGDSSSDDSSDFTFLFLHGNPTSSYLWRDVIAELASRGRCVAPDLIGMGDSDKLPNSGAEDSYRFVEHADFLDKLIDCAIPDDDDEDIVLVIHDWGSALGFWWAYRFPERIKGIIYMEAMVAVPDLGDIEDPLIAAFFTTVRTPDVGELLVLGEQNLFIELGLPSLIIRNLTEDEMAVYRAPYLEAGESRRPLLKWAREVPFGGMPEDVAEIFNTYSSWMGENEIPKLFVNANPGAILVGPAREVARAWKNQVEVTVPGIHFIQEDSPLEIAEAVGDWLDSDVFDEEDSEDSDGKNGGSSKKGGGKKTPKGTNGN